MHAAGLRRTVKEAARRTLGAAGLEVHRRSSRQHRFHRHLIDALRIDTVVDVGANVGQFGLMARQMWGFAGAIVSFEPLPSAFEALTRRTVGDRNWTAHDVAIGATTGNADLNVSRNSVSSSLLAMSNKHLEADPRSEYVDTETVSVRPLDDYAEELAGRLFVKIDVQGGERDVLEGARRLVEDGRVMAIHAELSFVELYEGQADYLELLLWLRTEGYEVRYLLPTLWSPVGQSLLQADVTVVSRSALDELGE